MPSPWSVSVYQFPFAMYSIVSVPSTGFGLSVLTKLSARVPAVMSTAAVSATSDTDVERIATAVVVPPVPPR